MPSALNHAAEVDGGEVADGDLIGGGVLKDLRAEVGGLDGSEILLVGLVVAVVLVEHVRGSGLNLRVEDGKPELLGLDGLPSLALLLVFGVELAELLSVAGGESGALVGAHKGPVAVGLDALHEDVRHPEGIKEVTGAVELVTVVFLEVKEGKDVGVPRLEVGGDGALSLSSSLVDITGRVVEDTEHGNDSVGGSVGAADVRVGGADVVDGKADSTGVLGDNGAVLEGVIDAGDTVLLHG
mmetsp:Transcript_23555/g.49046  ORF Transcript_23555/g.49046 Transcript_23555/m.49046 type:complete len:240 (-) Transcript_23555:705-1424(-)